MTPLQSSEHRLLIESAQSGNATALNLLLGACQVDARRYARRHCFLSDVDDAVQEAMLIVSKKIRSLKAAAAFSGWLFTIVRRECQRMASHALGKTTQLEQVAEEHLATCTDEAIRLDVVAALESLPPHYLHVILLRDFAELTIAEMAAQLQMETPGVKSRLHRARELMREYLLSEK